MNEYETVAGEALKLLSKRRLGDGPETYITVRLLMCMADQVETLRRINLALALEMLDAFEHANLNGDELAACLQLFQSKGIVSITYVDGDVSFTEDAWRALPRTPSGKPSTGKGAVRLWEDFLLTAALQS